VESEIIGPKVKVKVKPSTCCSTSYTRQTQDQKHFTILEVAADWHELMIPQRICSHPLLASANNWTRGLQQADIPPPQSATLGLHPVAHNLIPRRVGG